MQTTCNSQNTNVNRIPKYFDDGKMEIRESDWKADWMKHIRDDVSIADLSIPGTHDSMAFEERRTPFVQCQTSALSAQLNYGLRFFDVRFKTDTDKAGIYHNMKHLNKTLRVNVLPVFKRFLEEHPTEFLVVRFKDETSGFKTKDFFDTDIFEKFRNLIWQHKGGCKGCIPNVGHVRKHVVILREFEDTESSLGVGLPYPSYIGKVNDLISVEDDYFMLFTSYNSKMKGMWRQMKLNHENLGNKQKHLSITFASGTGFPFYTPYQIALTVNQRLYFDLVNRRGSLSSCGVVVMDYPGIDLVKEIIALNDHFLHDKKEKSTDCKLAAKEEQLEKQVQELRRELLKLQTENKQLREHLNELKINQEEINISQEVSPRVMLVRPNMQ